jgi:hypothetical protein
MVSSRADEPQIINEFFSGSERMVIPLEKNLVSSSTRTDTQGLFYELKAFLNPIEKKWIFLLTVKFYF